MKSRGTGNQDDQGSVKHTQSRHEYDLYFEEKDVPMPIIRVKHFKLPGNNERWKIFSEDAIVFVIEGSKLNKKQRAFLRGLDGINFLIGEQKKGIRSLSSLKLALKKALDT